MVNPYRGEVALIVDGKPQVMRLTLGTLARLEARLEANSLLGLIERFETGQFATADLIALLAAGLTGGGSLSTEDEVMALRIDGGPLEAARAAAQLLKVTFCVPGDDAE